MIALASCGGSGGTSGPSSPNPEALNLRLTHMPRGTATTNLDPAGHQLTITLRVIGLAPNSPHPAHVHSGNCNSPGPVLYSLKNVQADAAGVGEAATVIPNVDRVPTVAYVHIHTGPTTATADEDKSLICADLAGRSHDSLTMEPHTGIEDDVEGTASLALDPSTHALTVKVMVTGLQAGSSHPSHIHSGKCAAQGAVAYPLNPLLAGLGGTAQATTVIPSVSAIQYGAWYVNVHRGPGIDVAQGFNPVACADVVRPFTGGPPG